MDTIRTYLENMFLNLPKTPETLRAKEELFAMMEDKYNELKAAGKSENEAVGTVIAEFGNLEELDLGTSSGSGSSDSGSSEYYGQSGQSGYFGHSEYTNDFKEAVHTVSSDEADDYLRFSRQSAVRVALGVMLCIFSPAPLIFLGGIAETIGGRISENIAGLSGLLILFLFVAIAVALFISYGTRQKQFDYLKKEPFHMDFGTSAYVRELHSQFRSAFSAQISLGVSLCILSVVPLLVSALLFEENELLIISCVSLLLLIVGVAVFLLVQAGMMSDSFKVLLQEEDYAPQKKHSRYTDNPAASESPDAAGSYRHSTSQTEQPRASRSTAAAVLDVIAGFYWPIVTAIYLGSSFLFGNWNTSWLIWIFAGILCGPFYSLVNIFRRR